MTDTLRVAALAAALALSACGHVDENGMPVVDAVMSPLCLFNCVTVIHYANGVETIDGKTLIPGVR